MILCFCTVSYADGTKLTSVPFTASVSLRSITLKAGQEGFRPSEMRVVRPLVFHRP